MLRIILSTTRSEAFQHFAEALSSDPEVRLEHVASKADTLDAVCASSPHLVIIDSNLPEIDPPSLIPQLLMINAMVNTAVVSPLSDPEFHEATEGLGILSRLPVRPAPGDAIQLLHKLRKILGHSK